MTSNITALQQVKISSFRDATAFVGKLLSPPANAGQVTASGEVKQALDALYRKALEDGYALATHTRETVSVAPQRAALLVAEASATADFRGDVGANTATAMAVLDQLGGLKATLASILEIQATRRLVPSPNMPSVK